MTMATGTTLQRAQRAATNLFLVTIIVLFFLDAVPKVGPFKRLQGAKKAISTILDKTALWQGEWMLFCPDPLHRHVRVSARLIYEDGQVREWNSPNWSTMSPLSKIRHFRKMNYFEYVRSDSSKVVWEPLATHLARTNSIIPSEQEDKPVLFVTMNPKEVVLIRHWRFIRSPRPPDETTTRHWLLGEKLRSTVQPEKSSEFYRWRHSDYYKL
jgi:hypothetical protein